MKRRARSQIFIQLTKAVDENCIPTINGDATSKFSFLRHPFLNLSGLANKRKTENLEIFDIFLFQKYYFP
jgi:hypothetical protein